MSTIVEQVNNLRLQIGNNLALINGTREQGFLYSFYGNKVRYGCYVSNNNNKTITFDDSEALTQNPDVQIPPLRPEEYANIAIVYGEVFLMASSSENNIILDDQNFPSSGFTRNDIVYLFVGDSGASIGIMEGTSTSGSPVDPVIPRGSLKVARVKINSTGITLIEDLRSFVIDGGGGGTSDHNVLNNRDNTNQHPQSAITGLVDALAEKATILSLGGHTDNISNPHSVTYAQTGGITTIEADSLPGNLTVGSFWIQTNI